MDNVRKDACRIRAHKARREAACESVFQPWLPRPHFDCCFACSKSLVRERCCLEPTGARVIPLATLSVRMDGAVMAKTRLFSRVQRLFDEHRIARAHGLSAANLRELRAQAALPPDP